MGPDMGQDIGRANYGLQLYSSSNTFGPMQKWPPFCRRQFQIPLLE